MRSIATLTAVLLLVVGLAYWGGAVSMDWQQGDPPCPNGEYVNMWNNFGGNTIMNTQPSCFVHGWEVDRVPPPANAAAFCLKYFTFQAWIDGVSVPVTLIPPVVTPVEGTRYVAFNCLYLHDFPANYFTLGQHALHGLWCDNYPLSNEEGCSSPFDSTLTVVPGHR